MKVSFYEKFGLTNKEGFMSSEDIKQLIINYLKQFIWDDIFEEVFMFLNPLGETELTAEMSISTQRVLSQLNRYQNGSAVLVKEPDPLQNKGRILFLVIQKILFDIYLDTPEMAKYLLRDRIILASQILDKSDISVLREDLEDYFFQYLEPGTYANYKALRHFSASSFHNQRSKIISNLDDLLGREKLSVTVEARLKTIYSIHKKITRKNILYSQVLDIVGVRVLLSSKNECYKAMELILKTWPIMNNKIKDFIAVPKDNCYQSIHLTIYYQGNPVEIQVRTRDMHLRAQYGSASHFLYKLN